MAKSTSSKTKAKKNKSQLTIVGIGASAGGLAALKEFFKNVPDDTGLAYVVVVHLSPDHESHLANLLQPYVNMPVEQVKKTSLLEPNHVYVIPPGANLGTIDTHLRVSKLEKDRKNRAPIDHFFRTLASAHDGNSIGVVLTGTGSDGTLGIKEIKGAGGFTIVQDPSEAEYDGMPQSAIITGMVDFVLPLSEIPKFILRFVHTEPNMHLPAEGEELKQEQQHLLQKVFALIRTRTGRDFSQYKRSTILRRIQRRMQLFQIEQLEDYILYLREKPTEVNALSDEFLITVTTFFRDKDVFEQLTHKVIPHLYHRKVLGEKIRVWSVGCATGEEAYSLAMLLMEEAERREVSPDIQIFASDLHEHSLQKARDGFYPGDIETDVSQDRLKKFFVKEDGGYRVKKEIRELVVFAPHNLLADPPFSRIDLIVCRNVLIYLQRNVQRDVIELFNYALRPHGYLFLGSSETVDSTELFNLEDKKLCLFKKRNIQAPEPRLPVFPQTQARLHTGKNKTDGNPEVPIAYGDLHQRIVDRYAPPSILLNPDHKVVHLSENVGQYLNHPKGEFTSNVFKLVKEEFRVELRAILHTSKEKCEPVNSKPLPIKVDGEIKWVILSVYPMAESMHKDFAVIVFDEKKEFHPVSSMEGQSSDRADRDNKLVAGLQAELDRTKQQLQAIIEEYETGQEEMKASNEEMQSTNEELRSTLEELETSKEELQSMNEELTTLNQENRHKVEELSQLSGDLQNLLAATDIATLFLDRNFRILRFTPRVSELFNVRLADRGRPLSDYSHRLGYDKLLKDAESVLQKLTPVEREIQDEEKRWYLTRILPYRSSDDRIEGVVITFVEITSQKKAEKALRESEERYRAIVNQSITGICRLDLEGKLTFTNQKLVEILGYSNGELSTKAVNELVHPDDWKKNEKLFRQLVVEGAPFNIETRLRRKDGTPIWVDVSVSAIKDSTDEIQSLVAVIIDITDRKLAEKKILQSKIFAESIIKTLHEPLLVLTPDLKVTVANQAFYDNFQVNAKETEGKLVYELGNGQWDIPALRKLLDDVLPENNVFNDYIVEHEFQKIGKKVMLLNARRLDDVQLILLGIRDITRQTENDAALRKSESLLRTLIDASYNIVYRMNADWTKMLELKGQNFLLDTVEPNNLWEEKYLYSQDQPEIQKAIERAIRNKSVFEMEHRVKRADGELGWTFSRAVPLLNEDGEVVEWFGAASDITARKQAEEALAQSEEHLRLIMESAVDYAIFTFDLKGCITDWNSGAELVFGYTKQEIVGQTSEILFVKEDRGKQPLNEMAIAAEVGRAENERWHLRKNGSLFWGSGVTMPLRGKDHELRGFLKIMTDNTERVRMESDLKKAKETAEQAAKAKEDFLAHMSHEIRTPLNAIFGLTTLLLQQDPKPSQKENLKTLKFSAENLKNLVNDILDFSKIQAGKVDIEESSINLRELLTSLQKVHERQANEQGNKLEMFIDKNIPKIVRADQLKLSQVLNNLLGNAVKFTREGLIQLEVSLKEKKGKKLWLTFSVTDNGVGIPKEKQAHIFEMFTQVDNSTVRAYEGTGLGLSITKLLLEIMDSKIELESKEGVGSRFYFTLPLAEGKGDKTNDRIVAKKTPEMVRNLKLLLVEDMSTNRQILSQFLKSFGEIDIDETYNGQEAIEKVKEKQYDMILMDVRMPVMDGYQATKIIRSLDGYAEVPIIALTADTVTELNKHPEAYLFTDILTKPFDPGDLQQKIFQYAFKKIDTRTKSGPKGKKDRKGSKSNTKKTTSFNLENLRAFLNNEEDVDTYLQNVIANFPEFRQQLSEAVTKRDANALSNARHKRVMFINLLGLSELDLLLEKCKELIQQNAPDEALAEARNNVLDYIKKLKTAIQRYLKKH